MSRVPRLQGEWTPSARMIQSSNAEGATIVLNQNKEHVRTHSIRTEANTERFNHSEFISVYYINKLYKTNKNYELFHCFLYLSMMEGGSREQGEGRCYMSCVGGGKSFVSSCSNTVCIGFIQGCWFQTDIP